MTNPASEDIAQILVGAGVGTVGGASGWRVSISREATAPDTCVTVYDNGGSTPHPNWSLDELDIQVQVRGDREGYRAAYDKVLEVRDVLLGRPTENVNTTQYVGIIMRGDFNFIQYDDNERPVFTLNFIVWREPVASGFRQAFS